MKIREIRKRSNLTQEELAEQIGVNRATLSKYETGQIEPSFSQLEKIADILDVSLFDLLPPEYHSPVKTGYEMGYWEREAEFHDIVNFACEELDRRKIDTQYFRMLLAYEKLNAEGRNKVVEYAEDLVRTGSYKPIEPITPIELTGKDGWVTAVHEVQEWQGKQTKPLLDKPEDKDTAEKEKPPEGEIKPTDGTEE